MIKRKIKFVTGSAAIVLSVIFRKHSYSIPRVVGPIRTGKTLNPVFLISFNHFSNRLGQPSPLVPSKRVPDILLQNRNPDGPRKDRCKVE